MEGVAPVATRTKDGGWCLEAIYDHVTYIRNASIDNDNNGHTRVNPGRGAFMVFDCELK